MNTKSLSPFFILGGIALLLGELLKEELGTAAWLIASGALITFGIVRLVESENERPKTVESA